MRPIRAFIASMLLVRRRDFEDDAFFSLEGWRKEDGLGPAAAPTVAERCLKHVHTSLGPGGTEL